MSSCQGELPEMKFAVKADDQNGNVLVDENRATLKNGFFELWLPRNRRFKLTIQGAGRQGSGEIATFDGSKTCVTTLQLK